MDFYLAPVGRGKTDAVLERITQVKADKPFASVWVLLATERQILDFRRRMMMRSSQKEERRQRVVFNVEFFNFYTLYARILALAGEPQRQLSDPARYHVIRAVLRDLKANGALPILGKIAHTPGLARIAADFIYELKQSLIDVELFEQAAAQAAQQANTPHTKQIELARIYAAYQRMLVDHDLIDREGEGWVALSALARNSDLATTLDLLVCDGYDQFNPLQARLLTLLGARAHESITTLTTVPGREATIGLRFKRALDRLLQCHHEENFYYDLHWELFNSDAEPRQHASAETAALRALADTIFAPDAVPYAKPVENVRLIEAPDPTSETAAVLRRVKHLLLNGARPDDIVIAVRDWALYGAPLRTMAHAYGLPMAMRGEPLIENPALAALIQALDLHSADFPRRALLDVARSPYLNAQFPFPEAPDLLDALSRAAFVTGGRADWLACIQAHSVRLVDEDETDTPSLSLTDEDTARLLKAAFTRLIDAVTPPAQATVWEYCRWLEALIGDDPELDPDAEQAVQADEQSPNGTAHPHAAHEMPFTLSLIEQVRTTDDAAIRARDLAAIKGFLHILDGMVSAETLLRTLHESVQPITWAEFWGMVKTALAARTLRYGEMNAPGRDGRILATTITDARGLPHAHVCIVGLSEGVFPAPIPEDPLLLDSERTALEHFGAALTTAAERADEDGLFYELINLASQSLTLSRFTLKEGAPLLESHLWRAVRKALPNAVHQYIRPGQVVSPEQAASLPEALIAAADGLETAQPQALALAAWLKAQHPALWRRIERGRRVEWQRLGRGIDFDAYSGVMVNPHIKAQVAALLGESRVWSASQLTDYGTCAFKFFARRLLKLERLKEPEEGMDALQFGNVVHDLLEAVYRRIARIDPESLDFALRVLDEAAAERLPSAPERFGFRRSALWDQEQAAIVRRARRLIAADFNDSFGFAAVFGAGERAPYRLEAPFSGGAGTAVLPVTPDLHIRVNGRIDRIDVIHHASGDRLVVMDYKTSSTKIPSDEIVRGRNFQMMLYIRMVERLSEGMADGTTIAGGAFVHVGTQKTSGVIRMAEPAEAAVIDQGMARLAAHLQAGRDGNFAVQANKIDEGRCSRSCDYHQFCRMAVTHRKKRMAADALQ
ncbi:MAG: PD-(D/E)XK nuclease family protein [bacterium]|nr:PD-(D/E)XK nuclease family protein [bacterium]